MKDLNLSKNVVESEVKGGENVVENVEESVVHFGGEFE